MAEPDPTNVRLIPAKVCRDPTDLTTPFPHGGVALGNVRAIAFRPNAISRPVTAMEFGGLTVEAVSAGQRPVLAFALRDFDADALALLFPTTEAGLSRDVVVSGNVQDATEEAPSPALPDGELLSDRACVLYVSPESDRDQGLILFAAIPVLDRTAALRFAWAEEQSTPCVFYGAPDEDGRTYKLGLRRSLAALLGP